MFKFLVGTTVLALALSAGAARAADLPVGPYSAPVLSTYNWSGPYIGANLGYQWGNTTHNPTHPSGIAGGLQGGYNWQRGQFVWGLEGDFTITDARDTFAPWKFSNPWFGTARGRAGYALNNILFYGTLGLALGEGRLDAAGFTESQTHFGWTAGAGMEVGMTQNLTARVEYLFVDLSGRNYVMTGTSNGFKSSMLRLAFNYRF